MTQQNGIETGNSGIEASDKGAGTGDGGTAPLRVAIQGIAGCFHDAAARSFFASKGRAARPVECESFDDVVRAVTGGAADFGAMAIENTIAGPLLPNNELLRTHPVHIVGESKMRISHALLAPRGCRLADIGEVRSHPMAIMQCDQFLKQHPGWHITEVFDTAGAAREVAGSCTASRHAAAISPIGAAATYGLDVLADGIETNKHNYTRFLILAPGAEAAVSTDADKASIVFSLPHTEGTLSKVLTALALYDMNMTRIQSMPVIGREWEYRFYIDLTFKDIQRCRQALDAARPLMGDLKVLGLYKDAPTPAL